MNPQLFEIYDVVVDQNTLNVSLSFLAKTGQQISLEMSKDDIKQIISLILRESDIRLGASIEGTLIFDNF